MKINFDEIPEKDFGDYTPIPKGDYNVELVDVREGETVGGKNPGSRRWGLRFDVVDAGDYEGRVVWDNIVDVPGSAWRIKQVLRAAGFDVTGEFDTDELDWEEVIGTKFLVTVGIKRGTVNRETGEKYADSNKVVKFHAIDEE